LYDHIPICAWYKFPSTSCEGLLVMSYATPSKTAEISSSEGYQLILQQ
jgi:hypothetical protein